MNLEGRAVKIGPVIARVVMEFHEYARVVWVDASGRLRYRWHYRNELVPLHVAFGARSHWPERGDLDRRLDEQEERQAKAAEQERQKAARKARRKIKRGMAA
jgi:hypothetical protein